MTDTCTDNIKRTLPNIVSDPPKQGSDAWLEWRKSGITATEAAIIMFPGSFGRTPLRLYTDKLGVTEPDQSDSEGYMEWGSRLEHDIVDKFMEMHPDFRECVPGQLYEDGWKKCSLDAQCLDGNGNPVIVECKTGQTASKWNPVPELYYAQVQWQMHVSGIGRTYFSVLISGHQWFERVVDYNQDFVDRMLERCSLFWKCLCDRTPPAKLGFFAGDKEPIAALAGESGHGGPAEEIDEDTVTRYAVLKEAADKADRELAEFKSELSFRMVDSSGFSYKGRKFASWVERKGTVSVDSAKLKAEFPEAYAACQKQGKGTRYVKFAV